ncbi:EARLY FLOWERING 3 [Olea europaea subsp. europaea]|uniref:EARLY FLOWERING 3 n=1 Tax=Olea europaea subsp. europaea TaxID=158383 RepID=A0A8S0U2H2_OLEEU|nr:EARLY FLOWERING 3 [Olea europaea subsp. europaea]
MKRGKDEDKIMVPMFPRLHVNDTDTGGPRAPPRNKMALYEQLSIPSQRFGHGVLPFNPTYTSNLEPSASSSQGTRKERSKFFSRELPPRHQAEKSYSQYSNLSTVLTQVQQKKKLDEDDFTVPIFTESHPNQDHDKYFSDLDAKEFAPSDCADTNHTLKFPKVADNDLKQTSMAVGSSNQEGKCLKEVNTRDFVAAQEQMDKALLNLSSINKAEGQRKQIDGSQSDEPRDNPANSIVRLQKVDNNIIPELFAKSQPAGFVHSNDVMRESSFGISNRHSSSFRDFPLEEQNFIHDLSDDMTSHEKSSCSSPQAENIDRGDSVSETSMVDSLSGLDISPDDVVGKIGQKHFWKARRAITNQQRAFAVQVFELHRLIKVQRLIATSPHLLLEDTACLDKPVKISPVNKLPLDYIAKAPPNISKRKSNAEKPNTEIECSAENTVGRMPLSSAQNGSWPSTCRPFLGNPLSPAASSDHNSEPWYFNQAQGHQWLIPVMSPSEGLVYKPYPGPGFVGPACGPPGLAPWMSNFSTPGYGVPASNHQYHQVPSFPPAWPQGYFPTYGMPFANPAFSGSSVEQTNHFNVQHQNTCNVLRQTKEAVPNVIKPHVAKNNELQTSTASSPTERPQCSREGYAVVGTNALQLLPTSPAVNVPDCSIQSAEPECPARVIKVVPRNARSATESAARIFQSIQEERKQYE